LPRYARIWEGQPPEYRPQIHGVGTCQPRDPLQLRDGAAPVSAACPLRGLRLTRDAAGVPLDLLKDIQVNTSIYFGTLTVVNICLGIAATVLTWLVGLPHPFLWGMLAAVLSMPIHRSLRISLTSLFDVRCSAKISGGFVFREAFHRRFPWFYF
jgi:hypothetical protein